MKKDNFLENNIFSATISDEKVDNNVILDEFHNNFEHRTHTHFINNRWENIYINPQQLPSVLPLISTIVSVVIKQYQTLLSPHETLFIPHELLGYEKNEFWFNAAQPGESTGVHNHNGKAFLSGVYYLQVPPNSGNIYFKLEDINDYSIDAEEGKLILFPAKYDHFVPKNKSNQTRISLAFNLYKLPVMTRVTE